MIVTKCQGNGQGSCKRCLENGKWNVMWSCFLYEIQGVDGRYCYDCASEIINKDKEKRETGIEAVPQ